MAYLPRDARREQIMNAVIDIVIREGLAAATVRRIAQELCCSPGQIHHHFQSAQVLRAEAVRQVWRCLEPHMEAVLSDFPPRERLLVVLSGSSEVFPEATRNFLEAADRLWTEALKIRDEPAVRMAICEAMLKMHGFLVRTVSECLASSNCAQIDDIEQVAVTLLAASQGYGVLDELGIDQELGIERRACIEQLIRRFGL